VMLPPCSRSGSEDRYAGRAPARLVPWRIRGSPHIHMMICYFN
jgi:hypothetical protein